MTPEAIENIAHRIARNWSETESSEEPMRIAIAGAIRAALRERDAAWVKYANHKWGCTAFPATSAEQILRDCSCGLRALLEEAADHEAMSGESAVTLSGFDPDRRSGAV